jgi:hypothetical protein
MVYHIFFLIINAILAIFFLLVGIVSMLMLWVPIIRSEVIQFILEDSLAIFIFGFAFSIIGLFILVNIILNMRRHSYHMKIGKNHVTIDQAVIHRHLTSYWKELFPKEEIPYRVAMKDDRIHLFVDLPFTPQTQQKMVLERMEEDLDQLFKNTLGYRHPFMLSASFKPG